MIKKNVFKINSTIMFGMSTHKFKKMCKHVERHRTWKKNEDEKYFSPLYDQYGRNLDLMLYFPNISVWQSLDLVQHP